MKHLLNDLSEEEKNRIREQHTGGKKIMIENFNQLLNKKLGEVKPLIYEQEISAETTDKRQELTNEIESLKQEIGIIKKGNFENKGQQLKTKLTEISNKAITLITDAIEEAKNRRNERELKNLINKKEELIKKRDELQKSGDVYTDKEKISVFLRTTLTALAAILVIYATS
jgi:hypothetical protein